MGRSAKLHKRVKKTLKSTVPSPSVQSAKKQAKTKTKAGTKGEHVLGGADYVTLLMGGRKKAAEEALKLPAPE